MEDQLWCILNNVNYWLDYSERKNALIIGILGIQLTIGTIIISKMTLLAYLSAFILGVCLIIALISFFPKTKIPGWINSDDFKKKMTTDNYVYYGDIAKYSWNQYCDILKDECNINVKGNKLFEDLTVQIVLNSKIAKYKLKIFRINFYLMILGQILFLLSLWIK